MQTECMSTNLTIEQIARMAHVSRSTVSRVLNNHPSVRPQVRERVLDVMRELNYVPHAAARSLALSRSNCIGLLIPRSATTIFADPFFSVITQSISKACMDRSYFVVLALAAEIGRDFYDKVLRGRHFDGVIMLSSDIDDPILPRLIKDHVPFVLIGEHPYLQGLTTVDVENRHGAYQAVRHLLSLGYRRIATITGSLQMTAGIDRRDGYKHALLEAGIPITPELIAEGDFSRESGYAAMRRLLSLPQRPAAVFIASDTMALGALRAIAEAGLSVPQDIAVVGFDGLSIDAFANPPLTTVRQPVAELGAIAAQVLIARLEGHPSITTQTRLPTTLVIRQSCGASRSVGA